ncbi:MAG: YdcF family protein [Verrucomicrobiales bacterium]|nr:YdcF family protein [Verrucomicrobiales bacterium]
MELGAAPQSRNPQAFQTLSEISASLRTRSRWGRWGVRFAILVVGALLLWWFRIPLGRTAARWWMVEESPASADAIVVLGGGEDYRPFAAAKLWKEGLAPLILVPNVPPSPAETLGLRSTTTEIILGVLKSQGVPEAAIQRIGHDASSTREEALAVKTWVEAHPSTVHILLVPTDPFATRRTNWFFEKTLPGIDTRVLRIDPHEYTAETWWEKEQGLIAFQNEVLKNLYYHLKY